MAFFVFHHQIGLTRFQHPMSGQVHDIVVFKLQTPLQLGQGAFFRHVDGGAALFNKISQRGLDAIFLILVVQLGLGVRGGIRHEQDPQHAVIENLGHPRLLLAQLHCERDALSGRHMALIVRQQFPTPMGGQVLRQEVSIIGLQPHDQMEWRTRRAGLSEALGESALGAVNQLIQGSAQSEPGGFGMRQAFLGFTDPIGQFVKAGDVRVDNRPGRGAGVSRPVESQPTPRLIEPYIHNRRVE